MNKYKLKFTIWKKQFAIEIYANSKQHAIEELQKIVLKDDNLKYNKKIIADPKWVVGEIIKHYQKWKDYVRCNFKVDGLS